MATRAMYEFETYDPAKPRMVTSFKGNQKLIFQGYRYNIHHVVPAKGLKTWRCVCAKKLTSARSWCKGRAETWENDTQGISKGEHNHPAEHEVAEQEYFKSQLILAAIANGDVGVNDLIDEATAYMSKGVIFGSRESLRKSLMQARKSSENGVFKLKNYKNSDPTRNNNNNNSNNNNNLVAANNNNNNNKIIQHPQQLQQFNAAQNLLSQQLQTQQQQQQQHSHLQTMPANNSAIKVPEKLKDLVDLKMFEQNGTMFSLISLAQQQQRQQQQSVIETNNNVKTGNKNSSAVAAAAAALLFNNNNNTNSNGNNGANGASGVGSEDSANDSSLFANSAISSSASSFLSQFVTTSAACAAAAASCASGGQSNDGSARASPSHNNNNLNNNFNGALFGGSDCSAAAADFLLNSGFELVMEGSTPKIARLDTSRLRARGANSSAQCASSSSVFNDSGLGMSPPSAPFHGQGRRRKNAASTNFDVMSGAHGFQTPLSGLTSSSSASAIATTAASNNTGGHQNLIQQQQKKKMARINNIFDRLSHKAAAAASSTSSMPAGSNNGSGFTLPFGGQIIQGNAANGTSNSSQRNSPFSTASSSGGGVPGGGASGFEEGMIGRDSSMIFPSGSIMGFAAAAAPPKHSASIETQTDDSFLSDIYSPSKKFASPANDTAFEESVVRLSACIGRRVGGRGGAPSRCECRVITVCCCSEETCKRKADTSETMDVSFSSTPSTSFDTMSPKQSEHRRAHDELKECVDECADEMKNVCSTISYEMAGMSSGGANNEDADVDVVGAPSTPTSGAASMFAAESVTKSLLCSMEKEKDDSDDAASLELNLHNIKAENVDEH